MRCAQSHSKPRIETFAKKTSSHHFALLSVCSFQDDPLPFLIIPESASPGVVIFVHFDDQPLTGSFNCPPKCNHGMVIKPKGLE